MGRTRHEALLSCRKALIRSRRYYKFIAGVCEHLRDPHRLWPRGSILSRALCAPQALAVVARSLGHIACYPLASPIAQHCPLLLPPPPLALAPGRCAPASCPAMQPLRLLTFNTSGRNVSALSPPGFGMAEKYRAIVDLVRQHAPHVVALQASGAGAWQCAAVLAWFGVACSTAARLPNAVMGAAQRLSHVEPALCARLQDYPITTPMLSPPGAGGV